MTVTSATVIGWIFSGKVIRINGVTNWHGLARPLEPPLGSFAAATKGSRSIFVSIPNYCNYNAICYER